MSEPAESPTVALCRHLARAGVTELPEPVLRDAKLHILDAIAAVISGSAMPAGRQGAQMVDTFGGRPEALVVATGQLAGAGAAAFANGMAAHADETDDSHAASLSHPGCAVVPAALAAAERLGSDGTALIRAVTAGYDVGCRVGRALGRAAVDLRYSRPSSHAIVGTFGAAAAVAVLNGADERQCGYTLSYAAQSSSGVTTWQRDLDHVEKAYVFAGSPAQSGTTAALMAERGATGVADVFVGEPNFLDALSAAAVPSELSDELGGRYEISLANIKKYCVGSPAQAAVQAAEEIARDHAPAAELIRSIQIVLPADLARVVDDRHMPDVNVQYLVAGTLVDGHCGFTMAHDTDRMRSAPLQRLRALTRITADEARSGTRSAELIVGTADGVVFRRSVEHVRGTIQNPMTSDEVEAKARDVMAPVIGPTQAASIVSALRRLEQIKNVRELRAVLITPAAPVTVPAGQAV